MYIIELRLRHVRNVSGFVRTTVVVQVPVRVCWAH
jgi:hypothetical protein